MREINLEDLMKTIQMKKAQVDIDILQKRTEERLIRRRPRSQDETHVLDLLCKLRWKRAEDEGKVKYIKEREWFYDFID